MRRDRGRASAMGNLGVCCENGEGVSQDYAEAKRLYEACLAQNDVRTFPLAARALARFYSEGLGVEKDDAKADEYERLAVAVESERDARQNDELIDAAETSSPSEKKTFAERVGEFGGGCVGSFEGRRLARFFIKKRGFLFFPPCAVWFSGYNNCVITRWCNGSTRDFGS
ncbi:MAG: sel1 repeat family protein, partial [Thermoguttaceae bacterium]|nr:sel1 repeat family protein [Thermoguttaceae bacterium]